MTREMLCGLTPRTVSPRLFLHTYPYWVQSYSY
jgi:hypothetical protein